MPTPTELIATYVAGPAALRAAVAGMTQEQLIARPVAGKWSTLEVIAHIADFEPVLTNRMKRTIALDTPLLLLADENEFAKYLAYQERDLTEELALIEAVRASTARILQSLPPETWKKTGNHAKKGLVTLESIVHTAGNHINHHHPFIADKRKALGV